MPSPIQFCVVDDDSNARLGKLKVPHRKVADWINFLTSPRQQVQILSAENNRGSITIYFQASEHLYTYLDTNLKKANSSDRSQALETQVAS
jgi:hypothetical protein